MQHNSLITEDPQTRMKGFKPENIRIRTVKADDSAVDSRIRRVLAETGLSGFSSEDRGIIEAVAESYRRLMSGEALTERCFVLIGHELAEFEAVSDNNVFRYLVYRYKYSKYPELKIASAYPPCVQIEPTSVCNFRCIMCYQIDESFSRNSSGHMGHMSLDLFKHVVDQCAGNLEAITFASRGEPLLNREIASMLDYCRGKFLGLKLNTNASLLTEKLTHVLLSSDLQTLVFSIDAADRDLYEKIRVNGKFDRLMRNLERLAEIRAKHYSKSPIIIRISGVKINDRQDLAEMEKLWGRFADEVAFTNYNPWQDSYKNDINQVDAACTELWRRMFVWWDGKTNPCDFDYKSTLSRWNIKEKTISEIWQADWYQELRRLHLNSRRSEVEPCRRCVVT